MSHSNGNDMFVYDLPYSARKNLCSILDINDYWEELGGNLMKFDFIKLHYIKQAPLRNASPTDALLQEWGTQNHTVLELFILLSFMRHYQAMTVLKPFVDVKYHKLLYEGEGNLSAMIPPDNKENGANFFNNRGNNEKDLKDLAIGEHNLDAQNAGKTMKKSGEFNFGDEKILNTQRHKSNNGNEGNLPAEEGCTPRISYEELEKATEGWHRKNLLGKGGFGTVYKGTWKNTQVAIKRLEIQPGGDVEDKCKNQKTQLSTELWYLNSCRHDNILPLYGYSVNGPHNCLVYQYMVNGSLEDRLLCREGTKPLQWAERQSIATGIARGLQFLHTFGSKPLIHGDIKSANILLDPYMEPKIGDFGLAREGPLQQYTHIKVSRVHGTRPYLPDEFLRARKFSTKVDTYSFGIVLFELASGLRAYDESRIHKFLIDHVNSTPEGQICILRDPKAGYDDLIFFSALITVGKCCTSIKAKDRPEMVYVLKELNTLLCTCEMPQRQGLAGVRNSIRPTSPYDFQDDQQRRVTCSPSPIVQQHMMQELLPADMSSPSRSGSSHRGTDQAEDGSASTSSRLPSPAIAVHPPTMEDYPDVPALTELLGRI